MVPRPTAHACSTTIDGSVDCHWLATATNQNSTAAQLELVSNYHPAEVLENPALDLLLLETPATAMRVRLQARTELLARRIHPIDELPPLLVHQWCLTVAKESLAAFDGHWKPRPGITYDPRQSIAIVEAFLAGKVTRRALSLTRRLAHAFREVTPGKEPSPYSIKAPKKPRTRKEPSQSEKSEIAYFKLTNKISDLCQAVCATTRPELIGTIFSEAKFLGNLDGKSDDEVLDYLEALLVVPPVLKKKARGKRAK